MNSLIERDFRDDRIVLLDTYLGRPVIVLSVLFWIASIFVQFDFEIRGPQAGPAYDMIDLM